MSRRMEREGIQSVQGIINARHSDEQKRRGLEGKWWQPFSVAEGFEELGLAIWYTRYRLIVIKLRSDYERADTVRRVRICLEASRNCDRPRLP
jgi:hypothetical protein